MTAWLGAPVHASVAASYRELVEAVERGEADLAWAPPLVCARVAQDASHVLTTVRGGETACRAALLVREGSGIASVSDLAGKRAAWVDRLSTSGHLAATAYLALRGLDPMKALASQRYAGSYRDALDAVARGNADVTSLYVVDGSREATLEEAEEILGPGSAKLAVVAMTDPAPYDALVIGARARDAGMLAAKLLELRHGRGGPAMLLEVCRAEGFVPADAASYALLAHIASRYL